MPTTTHADWRRVPKPARNEPVPMNQPAPTLGDETTPEELAEIERMLAMMEDGESALGCDYSDGPMSPNGCAW